MNQLMRLQMYKQLEDMNMNKVVPYEAIWDVDVLNQQIK